MRLRRLEFAVLGVTLAFAFFMGGFFTGRSWSAVNIVAVAAQSEDQKSTVIYVKTPEVPPKEDLDIIAVPVPDRSSDVNGSTETAQPSEIVGSPRDGDGKININRASHSELTDLPGIGNVLASRIIDYRSQHGDFLRVEDIRNVSGIGEKRFEAIQDKITVGN